MISKLKKNITLLNTISSLLLQFLTVLSGFIIPKLILNYFGSEVNGLTSSLNQFLSYISLLEGGITGVVMANLYKPLYENDYRKVSSIVKTTNQFFKKISCIFLLYSLGLAIFYPIFFKTPFSYGYVFSLTFIMSLGVFIQYCFSLTLKTLLNADKKVYIVSFGNSVMIIVNILLALISVKLFPSIHIFKLITSVLYLSQPFIYNYYIKKYYNIDKNALEDTKLLKSRWDGFAINIAYFIHFSTDIAILTIFTDLTTVSIYSVYALVTSGLRNIVQAISNAITPTIGHLYAKGNEEELKNKFYFYEYILFVIIFFLFTIAGLLITPFVLIYTKNIHDANYYQPLFGILLVLSEALYLIKTAHVTLAYSANKFKEITFACYIEAFINIVVSLLLVRKYNLFGVALGTICGMLYRMIYQVYYTNRYLIPGSGKEFYKKIFIFSLFTIIGVGICHVTPFPIEPNVLNWILHGILYSLLFFLLYGIITIVFYRKYLKRK